ncbi:MAG: D-alanyl-D-alanine carboxypeptidase family protein [Desertimonas sp.]
MRGRRLFVLGALALTATACSTDQTTGPAGTDATAPGSTDPATSSPGGVPTTGSTTGSTTDAAESSGPTADDGATTEPPAADASAPDGTADAAATPTATGAATVSTTTGAPTTSASSTVSPSTIAAPTTLAATTTTVDGQPPVVEAASYSVYDTRSGTFLATSGADTQRPVGSLMKLLTAHVGYAAGDPTRVIAAPAGLVLSEDESTIGIRTGQELPRDLLIRAMLKASANDAARMLALDIAGSEAAYAELMNAAAAQLGLANTHAVNVTGLDAAGQYSSANDMTRLGILLMANPSFQIAVRDPTAELNGQAFPNTNDLIGTYPGADGIKTGHTSGAGWCVLASATRENRRIIVAVLGAPSDDARDAAATALLNWGFSQP